MALATAEGALIAALTVGLIAGTAMAGRGGNGGGGKPGGGGHGGGGTPVGGGTISAPINLSDSTLSWGDRIRFDVTASGTTDVWVRLSCYQGGALVAQGTEGYFQGSLDDGIFGLYSPSWTGGAGDCTAKLTSSGGSVLAQTTFHVDA